MKLIIAGSRTLDINRYDIGRYLGHFGIDKVVQVVSGGCSTGPDNAAYWYALEEGIKHKEFPANWDKYGKMAGPMRNGEMAAYGDILLLIWDGSSKGSASMKARMAAMKKPIYEVILRKPI